MEVRLVVWWLGELLVLGGSRTVCFGCRLSPTAPTAPTGSSSAKDSAQNMAKYRDTAGGTAGHTPRIPKLGVFEATNQLSLWNSSVNCMK